MPTPTTPTRWNIPYQRNPFFTGREEVLNHLHRALHAEHAVALSQPQGITGLGGIGKTQTVLEYAYRYGSEYDAVLWVRANSRAALTSSMVELAQLLELPERHEQEQEIIVQAVLRWLRAHADWLLIYDNIDDVSLAEPFLPKAGAGHLLFTTRSHALGGLAQRVDLQQMDPDIGALLLLRRASLLHLQAALTMASPEEHRNSRAISEELDGLPLALDQAGAYIKETPWPLSDYLPLYRTRRSDLLGERGSSDQDYPASVATTWSLSFEQVSQANPATVDLLRFCAFLAPDAIPEEMLTAGASHLGPVLAPVVANPLHFDQACKEVLRFSLLQRGADERTLTVHRLVQAVLRDSMPAETQHAWMRRAVRAVNAFFPSGEVDTWAECEQVLPHALLSATWIEQAQIASEEAASLLHQTSAYLHDRARYEEAEPLGKRALSLGEQVLPSEDPRTADVLNSLALLFWSQGKYREAEPLFERALAIRKRLGSEDPDTAQVLNNLALLYQSQGKYAEAEPLYKRALEICERVRGPIHPQTALYLSNLAAIYRSQAKNEEAKQMDQQALAICEQVRPPVHPDIARSLNNLAGDYQGLEQFQEAESLHQRALAIYEQVPGPEHPNTADCMQALATLYRSQEKFKDAEQLFKLALTIYEQVIPAHPRTAVCLAKLVELYWRQGRYREAESFSKRALAIYEQEPLPAHPDTYTGLTALGLLYESRGKYWEAEQLFKRALAMSEQVQGPMHPDTAMCLHNLALVYQSVRRYREAELLFKRALAINEQVQGPMHIETAMCLSNLAVIYGKQRKYEDAEPLFTRALEICEEVRGPMHFDTAMCLNYLAVLYGKQRKYEDAEVLFKRALAICERQESIPPQTVSCLRSLAVIYGKQGKYEDAESLLKQALALGEEHGAQHPMTSGIRLDYHMLILQRKLHHWFRRPKTR